MGRNTLGTLEQAVMMVILALGDGAYGVAIRDELSRRTRREHTLGAVYTTLDRLSAKELLESYLGEPTPTRGGRAKRYFKLTGEGRQALDHAVNTRHELEFGLDLAGKGV
ncbi:PadR family transcriptional regulator [Nitrospirillum amazonense]|uniref:PadR family transcriptional regulator n=1 Tax=Nitrospirillum amazonense TaxID=28077 RepID=A0A560KIN5_9PROT|nr:helix-turn-helix transcriptional regulator [Nitrospirillum amazonense]MDG3444345.1 helix-turn-helix transcriptional regulator [Nitrospirillum amazonense]TWB83052.1 PadR family transcriptional regulator [Nitrospirillum amazonense]